MDKSPINILQEVLIKEGYLPKYSCTLDISDFKYEVTCKNLSATGIGTNKKEAKHNAAVNMLSLLNIKIQSREHKTENKISNLNNKSTCHNNEPNNTNIPSLSNTQTFPEYNYIGFLQELCMQHHLDLPLYELIQQSGPSHMRTFKIRSSVGQYETTGLAFCKKTAKQEAAKNLLNFLICSNVLPKDACEKIENYKKKVYNNSQDITIVNSDIEITKSILPIEISEIEKVLEAVKVSETAKVADIAKVSQIEKVLSTYVEPISNNMTAQNIINNSSTIFNNNNNNNNNNTINNARISQSKSIEMINDSKQVLENNYKKLDVSKSVEPIFTRSLEKAPTNYIESNSDDIKEQNLVPRNSHANLSSTLTNKDKRHKRSIEDDLRDFDIEISDSIESNETTLPLTELSRKALSAYIASEISDDLVRDKSKNARLTDLHNLFKNLHSGKISDDLRKKMYFVSKLGKNELSGIQETYEDVQRALRVKSEKIKYNKSERDVTVICLRLLTTPTIAQFGKGATEDDAKAEAMLKMINTILDYIK